ncbi:hypothetical protein GRF29_154g128341 [Pseudopithomyces chartarum]|uniref:Uncharacterized protein n=1 Tax=Pseudopithomyces chartarum TaxID=1892770 RepID=A0AAN6LTQ1_9PLEO|nr:hypothetical protein GRF29_154g128341 [Pseudopithomyces chartarum]
MFLDKQVQPVRLGESQSLLGSLPIHNGIQQIHRLEERFEQALAHFHSWYPRRTGYPQRSPPHLRPLLSRELRSALPPKPIQRHIQPIDNRLHRIERSRPPPLRHENRKSTLEPPLSHTPSPGFHLPNRRPHPSLGLRSRRLARPPRPPSRMSLHGGIGLPPIDRHAGDARKATGATLGLLGVAAGFATAAVGAGYV